MSRNCLVPWVLATLMLAALPACDLTVDAGKPVVEPPPAEPTRFVGMVLLIDTDRGSSGRAIFTPPMYDGAEILGITPDGTCKQGRHDFNIRNRVSMPVDTLSVGPEVVVSSGGDQPAMAKQRGTGAEPDVYYRFDQSARLEGRTARVSWAGDAAGGGISEPFDADLVDLPEAPTTSDAPLQALAGEPLQVDWAGPAGDMMILSFWSSGDDTLPAITCAVRDTGTTTLPVEVVAQLTPAYDRLELDRVKFRKAPYVSREGRDYGVFGIGIRQTLVELRFQPKRMFVTSSTFSGDLQTAGGGTSGLDGADRLCNAAATEAGLGGAWMAFLSDEGTGALERLEGLGPWYLLNGRKAFESKDALADDPLGGAVNITETGAAVDTANSTNWVWTGTRFDGTPRAGSTCVGWTSSEGTRYGHSGDVLATDYQWSSDTEHLCSARARLYCLEQ